MPTLNEQYFDASLRQYVQFQGFMQNELRRLLKELRNSDIEVNQLIRTRWPVEPRTHDLSRLLADIRTIRQKVFDDFIEDFEITILEVVDNQLEFERETLDDIIPVFESTVPVISDADVYRTPFQTSEKSALAFYQLFTNFIDSDRKRLEDALTLAAMDQDNTTDTIRRLRGTQENGFQDGVYGTTRRHSQAFIESSLIFAANLAKDRFFEANSSVIIAKVWKAVLDSRTSPICRFRDGQYAPVGNRPLPLKVPKLDPPTARPPAHIRCRSMLVPLLAPPDDTLDVNFRQLAKQETGRRWDEMSRAQKNRLTEQTRQRWLIQNVGQTIREVPYRQWFEEQSEAFQKSVLGPKRFELYRQGKLSFEQFHSSSGQLLTLNELRNR